MSNVAGRLPPCTLGRPCSTSTATTCATAAARRRSPAWCACSPGRHRRAGGPHRHLADGDAGLAGARRAARRAAATARPTRAIRRLDDGRRPDLPRVPTGPGTAPGTSRSSSRPAPRGRARPAAGRPRLHGVRRAAGRRVGQPLPARRAGVRPRARGRVGAAPRAPTAFDRRAARRAWDLDALGRRTSDWLATRRRPDRGATPRTTTPTRRRSPAALPARPRVAQVPVRRPGPARRAAARATGPAARPRDLFAGEATRLKPGRRPVRGPLPRPRPPRITEQTGPTHDRPPVLLDLTDGVATITLNRPTP